MATMKNMSAQKFPSDFILDPVYWNASMALENNTARAG